jgi:YrbI family 3-deoxy-D-manno-octulosonate 8-phosphate phosphatase
VDPLLPREGRLRAQDPHEGWHSGRRDQRRRLQGRARAYGVPQDSACFFGDEDKLKALDKIRTATKFDYEQMAFMGDELFDIPVIEKVGFSATVPHAVDPVKERVHYVTETQGGWGTVREVADAIRKAQKIGPYCT